MSSGICTTFQVVLFSLRQSLGWSLNRVKCHLCRQGIAQLFICFSPTVSLLTGAYDHWVLQSNSLALLSRTLWFLFASLVPPLLLLFHVSLSNWKILLEGMLLLEQKGQVTAPITVHATRGNVISDSEKFKRALCHSSVAGSFLCFFQQWLFFLNWASSGW